MLLQFICRGLWSQGYQTFKSAGHQISAGNAAEKSLCKITKLQRIENIKKIFLQAVVLIYERKTDQHITVDDLACIVDLTAPPGRSYGADRQRSYWLPSSL